MSTPLSPILFLDVDGVLNDHSRHPNGYCGTRPEAVAAFNGLLRSTAADIVVSSAWRYLVLTGSMTLVGFENLLLSHGVECRGRIIGTTCSDEDLAVRGQQIRRWLDANGGDRPYVVLDNGGSVDGRWDDLGIALAGHPVIWTEGRRGLTRRDAKLALKVLRGELVFPTPSEEVRIGRASCGVD